WLAGWRAKAKSSWKTPSQRPPMKPWSDSLHLPQTIRDVFFPQDPSQAIRSGSATEIERTAYERRRHATEEQWKARFAQQEAEFAQLQTGILESLRQAIPTAIRRTEDQLVHLACEVAGRLVAGLPVSQEMIEAALREALTQSENASQVLVYLHRE